MKKFTKIVATLGPSSAEPEMIEKLLEAGANVFRFNFSHGDHATHGEMMKRVRRMAQKNGKNIAILLDTKGPEIRTGDVKVPINVEKGAEIVLTVAENNEFEESGKLSVHYDEFVNDVEVGEKILVDNGVINFRVQEKTKTDIICEVLDGGEISSRRHLNLPGKDVSLESITEKDWLDIEFGVKMGVDFIALSFVRTAKEVVELKKFLETKKSKIAVIAKIESFEATKHIGTICEASDGIMVARGDLGAEVPFSQVPRLQREMVHTAAQFQKPVIVATHMLESMIHNPMPTRAVVTDISEAVWQRADAIMLSGETAGGQFPEKSVQTMAEVAMETEKNLVLTRKFRDLKVKSSREEFCRVAAQMAEDAGMDSKDHLLDEERKNFLAPTKVENQWDLAAIFVITRSGFMAKVMSAFRPRLPIFAFTNEPAARRKLQLYWGVEAFRIDFSEAPQKTIKRAREKFLMENPEFKGKKFILVSDFLVDDEFVPTLQIREF